MFIDSTLDIINDTLKLLGSHPTAINHPINLISDSFCNCKIGLDTIMINNISSSPIIPSELIGIFGVMLGVLLSYIASLFLEKQKSKIAIKRDFFSKRFEAYNEIMKLLYKGYSAIETVGIGGSTTTYPKAYNTFESLNEWLNSMVEFIDKSLLFIDQNTYRKFNELNWKILEHIKKIKARPGNSDQDIFTRNIGVNELAIIQDLTKNVMRAIRNYLNDSYKLKTEEVI